MRVAVLGASGFISKRFVDKYREDFDILELHSKNAPLNDYEKLKNALKEVDVLVHAAFDHSYKSNILGIKNILRICNVNNIKKLIYLSSFSVYDLEQSGKLDENSKYSTLNDPYSKEKRAVEKIIDKYDKNFQVIVLQPTIVYGVGGNWTKYALHICKSNKALLPHGGENIANIIYVDDVALAIYNSINSDVKYEKFLISAEVINWKEFYCKQCEILKELKLPSNCKIEEDPSENQFHSNSLINFIFILWFKTPLGNIFDLMIGVLKKLRSKSYNDTSTLEVFKEFLQSDVTQNILNPSGITKKVHSVKFIVDTSKANKMLNFSPKYSFNEALQKMQKEMETIIK